MPVGLGQIRKRSREDKAVSAGERERKRCSGNRLLNRL